MDQNANFRSPLYSTICCLLVQDDQALSTPAVSKLIEVIRTHLESTSRFYASVSASIHSKASTGGCGLPDVHAHKCASDIELGRKSSLDSVSIESSTSSSANTIFTAGPSSGYHSSNLAEKKSSRYERVTCGSAIRCTSDYQDLSNVEIHLRPEALALASTRQKPVDFRRISSVSYNDEQLINDLRSTDNNQSSIRDNFGLGGSQIESPWRYDELSSECKFNIGGNCHTSQSSLDNQSTGNENIAGSSVLGACANDFFLKSTLQFNKKRHSDISQEFLKSFQTNLSNLAPTDDYSSSGFQGTGCYSSPASIYDDESCTLRNGAAELDCSQAIDVQSRRAELEWTLNKLINYELKYTWIVSHDTLRRAIRKIGVPNEIRDKVWLVLIDKNIGTKYDAESLLAEANKTIKDDDHTADEEPPLVDGDTQSILKQINLDVSRTMPGHKLFKNGAEGGIKLRRILVAYSIHVNKAIAYCQGFNFIVALLLSVFEGNEERALRGFICIVDHIFPSKFYFDHYLTGARADQFLLADFICDQLIKSPTATERKMVEGVTSSITLNWFISLFHGAVPTLTRLTILDHFMLEGVKALFRFTMAILYLAFQTTAPSSCEVFTTIRNTARDMYDVKLLLSIVEQIKLPKDSYFAIRRSFYMVQSSSNSDQFYMQSLSNDANRQLVASMPLSVQQLPNTKPPAMSLISSTSTPFVSNFKLDKSQAKLGPWSNKNQSGSRVCVSSNRSKICIQNIGKLGRSHIKVTDTQFKSNERSLISPLRNCLVIGVSDCGKIIIMARQSAKRTFRVFREQDLVFHVYEINVEVLDGFYLESSKIVLLITASGELFKLVALEIKRDFRLNSMETLMLKECGSIEEDEKLKIRISSMDTLTNFLWIYVECEDTSLAKKCIAGVGCGDHGSQTSGSKLKLMRPNSPSFPAKPTQDNSSRNEQLRINPRRKMIVVDVLSFDIFSTFELHPSFGDIISMKTTLMAFCLLANPMSNQFSSRMVRVGPTGQYEHLFSFSEVVDYSISLPYRKKGSHPKTIKSKAPDSNNHQQKYSTLAGLLPQFMTLNSNHNKSAAVAPSVSNEIKGGKLTSYYRSLMRRHSVATDESLNPNDLKDLLATLKNEIPPSIIIQPALAGHTSETSSLRHSIGSFGKMMNGKIAMFEFTETYAVHTRESQLDRYDYLKVVDVTKDGQDFILTILTIFERLIKVVI